MFTAFKQLLSIKQEEAASNKPAPLGDALSGKIEWHRYANGLLSRISDARRRTWTFTYAGGKLVRFTDPSGITWCEENGRWHGFRPDGKPALIKPPLEVHVEQESGEVRLREEAREVIYKPDGNTCVRWHEIRDGADIGITVTEYATMPGRTRVTVEKHLDGKEFLRAIEDANGRCYRFDYNNSMLSVMTDWSGGQPISWRAVRDGTGHLVRWLSTDDQSLEMAPHLNAVDLQGNRYYKTADGREFVVKPNGSAFVR